MQRLFSDADQIRIRDAVAAAEQRTGGEIVPVVADRSATYTLATLRGALLGAATALLAAMVIYQFYAGWSLAWLYEGWGLALWLLGAGSLGAALALWVPPVRRALAGRAVLEEAVHLAAMKAFVEEEVFDTRDRTGVLLYLSLFEHRVEVLGDSGIVAAVPEEAWADVVVHLCQGIRNGRPADALIEAISECGGLLEGRGVALRDDDTDELRNELRFRKR